MSPVVADTIVAVATAAGRAGISVVRVSGPLAAPIAGRLLGIVPAARRAALVTVRNALGEAIDEGLALYFPGPSSYTGEDVLELQVHGGRVVPAEVVAAAIAAGARHALPGEFSRRAYENGRLDLAQAEAVADLIAAGSRAQARAALRSLSGEFSDAVGALKRELILLRVEIEAGIDFSDEGLDLASEERIGTRLTALAAKLAELGLAAERGRRLTDGARVVIAGRPNAGKSSLLNRLAGHDAAIVSAEPGTTRDLLKEEVVAGGALLELIDTAGLRPEPGPIEAEGIRRAIAAMAAADHVLYVVDAADPDAVEAAPRELASLGLSAGATTVFTKTDRHPAPAGALGVSTRSGAGMTSLLSHLEALAGGDGAGAFSARQRHCEAIARAAERVTLASTAQARRAGAELVAEELRLASRALGEVTGEFGSEELLGAIFSTFCIGK